MTTTSTADDRAKLLQALAGSPCHNCEEGVLVRQPYKGNRSIVCNECGLPQIQLLPMPRVD